MSQTLDIPDTLYTHVKITPLGNQLAARERFLRRLQGNLITQVL
jgi:hypothetical protein